MTTLNFDIDTSAKTTVLQWAMRWRQSYFLLFLQFVNWPTNQEIILMGIVCNYYILFLSYTGLQDNSTFSKIDLEDNGMTGKHIHALAEMLLQNHYVSDIVSTPDCIVCSYITLNCSKSLLSYCPFQYMTSVTHKNTFTGNCLQLQALT